MTIRIDASELHTLGDDLDRAGNGIGAKASLVIRKTAFAIEATAKGRAPVDTGNLKNSISTDIDGDGRFSSMSAEVGPTAEYGIYVELGTRRQAPQPYLGPAFDQHIDGFTTAMASLGAEIL